MSIKDDDNLNAQQQANTSKTFTLPGDRAQAAAPAPEKIRHWDFTQGALTGPISREAVSETVFKLRDALAKMVPETIKDNNFEVFIETISPAQAKVYYSGIVIGVAHNSFAKRIAYYTLVLTDTAPAVPKITQNINGQQVQLEVLPDEVYDADYVAALTEFMANRFPQHKLFDAGAMTLGRFNTEDKIAVKRLLSNASFATMSALLASDENFGDLNLATLADSTKRFLNVDVKFDNSTILDAGGRPVRSDFLIDFYWQAHNQGNGGNVSPNSRQQAEQFSSIGGFMDVVYAPKEAQNTWMNQGAVQYTPPFVPRMIITNLEPLMLGTLPAVLLALSTAFGLGARNNWMHAIYHRAMAEQADGNPSILRVQANPERNPNGMGAYVDVTNQDAIEKGAFGDLMMTCFRPEIVYSVDVPLAGATSWVLDVLRAAADGSAYAREQLIDAAMVLTNGAFGQTFDPTAQMFYDNDNLVLLGNYVDQNGRMRDIREVDYIGVSNRFVPSEQGLGQVMKWHNSYYNDSRHEVERLRDRREIIEAICGGKVEYTGKAKRVTIGANFIHALEAGILANKMEVSLNLPASRVNVGPAQGRAGFVDGAAVSNQQGGIFRNRGLMNSGNGGNLGTRTYNRFDNQL
jgi:hypothetical protein